jgi:hypothetical protein
MVDTFVIFDDVQFLRRSWICRNRYTDMSGNQKWLNLPLIYGERDLTMIKDVQLKGNFNDQILKQVSQIKIGAKLCSHPALTFLKDSLVEPRDNLVDYLENQLVLVSKILQVETEFVRSSCLDYDRELRGQEKVLAILENLRATHYINLSGGKHLYNKTEFDKRSVKLKILPEFSSKAPILERIVTENLENLRNELKQSVPFRLN